jgi:[glutamine synthetase] adenylyltransferase / [glutamine synthetase]-adenylyl-L-tyrosine phosphorylase
MRPALTQAPFRDSRKAQQNWLKLEQQLPAALTKPLFSLLAQSPDPDGALNLLERYAQTAAPGVLRDLGRGPAALSYLVAAFGFGGLLAEAFLAEPDLATQFARDRNFTRLRSREALLEDYARFSTTHSGLEPAELLARFKRRNYVRIGLKDVLGLATLAETTLELSWLADVIVTEALLDADQELAKRYGQPQYRDAQGRVVRSGFSIVSLGKLGGGELNYSSDIDLLFLYSKDGETSGTGAPESVVFNREYFIRLAQAITGRLTQATSEGQVFRVDLRLRPEGDQGDLTLSISSALDYYARRARDWELQMLIKARHSAGDARLTRTFLRGVESHIYSSPGHRTAITSVLTSRERIARRLREGRGETLDVKRQPGGIRDIEFLAQCLQRLFGAREPWVRSGGTLLALRKLNEKTLLSDRDFARLTSAYEFLRKVEHRIQLDRGQQSHRLPSNPAALDRLARRAGVEGEAEQTPGAALITRLHQTLSRVDEIRHRLIQPGDTGGPAGSFELKPSNAGSDPGRHSYPSMLRLLNSQALDLARRLREANFPARIRPRAARFLAAVLASPETLDWTGKHPAAWERALEVLRASECLSDFLIRHPQDLAALDPTTQSPASTSQMELRLDTSQEPAAEGASASGVAESSMHLRPESRPSAPWAWANDEHLDIREKTNRLRQHFRERTLDLGARDCVEMDDVFSSLRRWSDLAACSAATAYSIASEIVRASASSAAHAGEGTSPSHASADGNGSIPLTAGQPAADETDLPFAVLALGRLGLGEFDLGSDADLIFVAASRTSPEALLRGTHLAEKMIETLSAYTREGAVFAVDTRLRPRGSEGELLVTEDAFLDYAATAAQPWEALTYLKLCTVAGNAELGERLTTRMVQRLFDRFTQDPCLAQSLQEMRRRLEKESRSRASPTKTAPGGYYDVDFAVSYLRIRHRLSLAPGANMPQQIAALAAAGALRAADAETLTSGAVFLRATDHAVRLVTGRPARSLPERPGQAESVEHLLRLWNLVKIDEPDSSVQARLNQVQQELGDVYNRVLASG